MFNGHRVYNLTPHALTLMDNEGNVLENFPPSGRTARVTTARKAGIVTRPSFSSPRRRVLDNPFGIPAVEMPVPGEVMTGGGGIPDVPFAEFAKDPNELFLVSRMVLDALVNHGYRYRNVFSPDTSSTAKRNEQGQVVGVTRFVGMG